VATNHLAGHTIALQLQARHRHGADHDVLAQVRVGREVRGLYATEIREGHLAHLIGLRTIFQHGELELDLGIVAGVLVLQVPLAVVRTVLGTPAEADGAIGQHDLAVLGVGHGLPVGVVALVELAGEVAGTHVAVGHHDGAAVGQ